MTVAAEAVVLVNAAISRTGGNFIATDFGTGVSTDGVEKNLAYLNYERIVNAELLSAPYRFARKTLNCTLGTGCSFTASIATTVLTVTDIASGSLLVGQTIAGAGVTGGTTILSEGTGEGGLGTYNLSVSQTVSSEAMTATGTEAAPPLDTSWRYSWTLPSDLIGLRTVMRNGCVIPYEIGRTGTILTNYADAVLAAYTFRAAESVWPQDFSEGITCRMEAVYLRNDSRFSEADDRDAAANAVFSRARLNHSQEEAPSDRRRHPLISARRIGRAACHN